MSTHLRVTVVTGLQVTTVFMTVRVSTVWTGTHTVRTTFCVSATMRLTVQTRVRVSGTHTVR